MTGPERFPILPLRFHEASFIAPNMKEAAMNSHVSARRRGLVLGGPLLAGLFLAGRSVHAQVKTVVKAAVNAPELGTPGKDAGWIPTPNGMVESMLEMADVSQADFVVDLGSGDGRIPILAAKQFGARAMGIELNPDMVAYSQRAATSAGVADRAKFVRGDIFQADFSRATVVTLFMTPSVLQRLQPKLLAMKPGTRILSYLFAMDGWEPDEWTFIDGMHGMLWVVPARAAGNWRIDAETGAADYRLHLEQNFQRLDGRITIGGQALPLFDTRLKGEHIRFTTLVGERRHDFTGTVSGNAMQGRLHVTGRPDAAWRAVRT
jgi:SAM-dependent methyltransferase